ncbi:WD40-repeat-containing domain protein [Hyaloraphidium curvatum]|nr:WD40-repeat-containing domain protein [Hyaloraphidium curvatum]
MMDIVRVFQRKRREFGRPVDLRDALAFNLNADIWPDKDIRANYVARKEVAAETQSVPELSEHEANTEHATHQSVAVQHSEGGWPRDVDSADNEQTARFRKKVEKDEGFAKSVKSLAETVEHAIMQNNAIDIYEEYFPGEREDLVQEQPSAQNIGRYLYPHESPPSATHTSWYPEEGHRFAVSYACLEFQKPWPHGIPNALIWNVDRHNVPDQVLSPSSALVQLKYNPKDPHILLGGCHNGTLAFWDTRKGAQAVESSSKKLSHGEPVFDVSWIQSKTGTECFSVSTDGWVKWWDTRHLADPVDSLAMDVEKNGKLVGGTCLDYDLSLPTKFLIGTEAGSILACNRKLKAASERIQHTYSAHFTRVCAVKRNAFFPKAFLSVGDWTAKIWTEDVRTSIFSTARAPSYLTDCAWSPSRPAVFATAQMGGSVDFWDYLRTHLRPVFSFQVSKAPICSVKFQDRGLALAAAAQDGAVTVLAVNDALGVQHKDEKQSLGQVRGRA